MDKCDMIPKWMFSHLRDASRSLVKDKKWKLEQEARDNRELAHKEIAIKYLSGKMVDDVVDWNYGSSFHVKDRISTKIESEQKLVTKAINDKLKRIKDDLDVKYQKWENDILTGKIKRSKAQALEL